MEKKTEILVVGRNAEILATIVRLINNNEKWSGTGCQTDEEALQLFNEKAFDVVLIGGGIDSTSEALLTEKFKALRPDIRIVKHYGGGSGLLTTEIMEAIR